MNKPKKLRYGDTVSIVSLSSGLAGDDSIRWRTEQGIKRLEDVFGLKVKVMPHALEGIDYIYENPENRAEDLNDALRNPEVKAIICCIGGNETIRIMPYVDFEALRNNPKIFSGYSDTTANHFMFYNNGISTSYGPALLTDFAENVVMDEYTIDSIKRTWFSSDDIGRIEPAETIREFGLKWDEENKDIERSHFTNPGYESINGESTVQGHLIGGCFEVFNNMRGTEIFPDIEVFDGAILFLETSEVHIDPKFFEDYLRALSVMGIFEWVNGVIVGRPQDGIYYEEYKEIWRQILKEAGREDLPVLYNMNFGHNEPKFILPYGLQAEVDTEKLRFTILESAVID
ncbi:S66 peptidase family protein [Salinicoccus sp. HZC-1]|uniref:S66 family peptidase n=1 Tax=Salinicoccus sp. HZC-1 TaxID=3385497 RepID=UPI00398B77F6